MSILVSKLVSVFTADTQDLKKGYDETKRGAKEVTRELKNTEDQANRTAESFMSMAKKAAGFLAAAVAAGKSAQQIISEAANMVALDNFSYTIDESVESVDAFSKAIVSMGGSASDAQSTLSTLFSKVKEASKDSASSAALDFAKMGVSVKDANGQTKDLMSVLYDLSGAVEGMDASKAREYIESIGITDRTVVEAMMRGRKELEGMIRTQKEMGVVSKESAENARAFDAAVGRLSNAFQRTRQSITEALLPAFTWVADKVAVVGEFISRNSTIIIGAFAGISAFLAAIFIPTLWSMAVAVIAATWPFILIAAIIGLVSAAIYALYEDFKFFEAGQDSFIGKLMDKYPSLGQAIVDVFEAIGKAADWLSDAIKWAMEAIGVDMEDTGGLIATTINAILGLFDKLAEWGYKLSGSLSHSWDLVKDGLNGLYDFFMNTFERIWQGVQPFIDLIKTAFDAVLAPIKWAGEKLGLWEEDEPAGQKLATAGVVGTVTDQIIQNASVADGIADAEEQKHRREYVNLEDRTKDADFIYVGVVPEMVSKSQEVMDQVVKEPLNSVTSNQISNMTTKSESKSYHLDVGEIRIETDATDTKGIAMGIAGALKEQLKSLEAESATGIAR